jgi:AAA domain
MALILGRYSIEYRSEIVRPLMTMIRQGESSCLVGMAGVGKSNLVTFLQQPEVREHYMPAAEAARTRFVPIACWSGVQSKDSFYHLMVQWTWNVAASLEPQMPDAPPTQGPPLFLLRDILQTVCRQHACRLVYILDEFDCLVQNQAADFFNELRGLRDEYRATRNLVFLPITLTPPQLVRGRQPLSKSKFFEIVQDRIYALPPYREADAAAMLRTLSERKDDCVIEPADRDRLIAYSGGHSGLLWALFHELHPDFTLSRPRLGRLVENSQRVRTSCERIWEHLLPEEQQALGALARGQAAPLQMEEYLCRRGLLVDASPVRIFSPVFGEYIRRFQPQ